LKVGHAAKGKEKLLLKSKVLDERRACSRKRLMLASRLLNRGRVCCKGGRKRPLIANKRLNEGKACCKGDGKGCCRQASIQAGLGWSWQAMLLVRF